MNDFYIRELINGMTIYKRKDGRWEGRITLRGVRKSFYGETKAEVKNKTRDYCYAIENGYQEPKKIRFSEYAQYWLKTYKWNKIEPSSYTRLYGIYEYQIKDTLGKMMIGDIRRADIQRLIDEHANPTSDDIKPLALSGLKRIMQFLRPCFEVAVQEKMIMENPCKGVVMPVESCIRISTKEQFTLSDDELERFKTAALSRYKTTNEYRSRDNLVLLLILNLGLRVGEALALEWSDIDYENKLIHVNKTIQSNIKDFNKDSGHETYSRLKKSTKTRSGIRVLRLSDTVCGYINELQKYDKRHGIESPYICSTRAGTRNHPRNLQRSLDKLVKRAEITERVSLHTLRHTFGSTLIRRGVGVEVVSKLMGHSNITVTYTKYIHVLQEEQAKTMEMTRIC